ncbi:hypothetical protein D6D04_09074 [Aureobasidium pullulans]|nr:hypothetical protein D6D04_09074 [Aureobasidium pullulans]
MSNSALEMRPPKSQSRERIAIASCFSARPKRWRPSPVTDAESEAVETQEPFEVSAVGTRDNVFNALLSETTTVWKESRVATDTHFTDVSTWAWQMVAADDEVYIAHLNHALFSQEDSRGPEACRDKTMFEIFRNSRFLIILSSLATRCPTYLSEDTWRTVPWQQQTVPKDNMDLLLDIMSEIPALRSRLFELQGNTGADNHETFPFYRLAEDALQVASQLQIWRGDWDVSPEGHIIELTESEPAKRLGEKSLHFTSLYAANCCSLCDASLILVLETVLLCAQPGQLNPGIATTLFEKSRQAAIEICQSLDYQLQNSHTRLGQLFVLWPLREAGKILAKGSISEQLLLEQQKQKLAIGQDSWEIAKSAFGRYG